MDSEDSDQTGQMPSKDWVDAQADLSLCWAHTHFVGFVVSWLKFCCWLCQPFVDHDTNIRPLHSLGLAFCAESNSQQSVLIIFKTRLIYHQNMHAF